MIITLKIVLFVLAFFITVAQWTVNKKKSIAPNFFVGLPMLIWLTFFFNN